MMSEAKTPASVMVNGIIYVSKGQLDELRTQRDKWKGRTRTAEWRVVLMGKVLGKADHLSTWARTHKGQLLGDVGEDELRMRALAYDEARAALSEQPTESGKLREAVEWAYKFITRQATAPDDGDQFHAIGEALGEALKSHAAPDDTPAGTRQCPECEGWGYVKRTHGDPLNPDDVKTCPSCDGEGLEYVEITAQDIAETMPPGPHEER